MRNTVRATTLIWRRTVLDRVLWCVTALCVVGLISVLSSSELRSHLRPSTAVLLVATTVSIALLAYWKSAPIAVRTAIFSAFSGGCLLFLVSETGFLLPNTFVGLFLLVVVLASIMGWRTSALALAGITAFIGVIGYGFVSGDFHNAPLLALDPTRGANWVRVIVMLVCCAAVAIVAVSTLVEKLASELLAGEILHAQRIEALEKQRELERRLVQTQKTEAMGLLAGGVAHDFNNLLTVITSNLQLTRENGLQEENAELVKDALTAASVAADLTRDLLAFSRQQVVERAPLALADAVQGSLRMVRRLLPENIGIETPAMDASLWVLGASSEVDQVVINLCVNARDAMPNGGSLDIRVERRSPRDGGDDLACLLVRDTGTGMDAALRMRIFEPFFTTKPGSSGTGLGLSVVQSIAVALGGFVEVSSEPGAGTEFRVFFPMSAQPKTEQAREVAGVAASRSSTILLVEDEPAVREVMRRVLSGAGHSVVACNDGEEGLEVLRDRGHDIALVVTDAIMPKMGGRELHDKAREHCPDLGFLFCSGYASDTLGDGVLNSPLCAFLAKPFIPRELLDKVNAMLVQRQAA